MPISSGVCMFQPGSVKSGGTWQRAHRASPAKSALPPFVLRDRGFDSEDGQHRQDNEWTCPIESSPDREGSLGLGLYIAREIVKAHGGEISARREATETVFAVRLPRC
jgi:hypothetical protein